MKSVDISEIVAGKKAKASYYSDTGELLISKGVTITEGHVNTLRRRNLKEVYLKPDKNEEIERIASKEFAKPDDLLTEESEEYLTGWEPRALAATELKNIKSGKEGLAQLNKSELAINLDMKIGEDYTSDLPLKPALKKKATQISVKDRTEEHKGVVTFSYAQALKKTRKILKTLADAERVDGKEIQKIIEGFIKIFLTDRNILLNISGVKHTKDYLFHHSLNVCLLSINIAASAGYSEKQIVEIGMGALLHDIGMLLIPKEIRFHNGKLSQADWYEVQKHPILGLHLLEKVKDLPSTIPYIAYQIHEREDGRGYPKQRKSRLIHRFAKIVQIADVFEAMSSPRSYRKAYIPHEGIQRMVKMVEHGLMPSNFTNAFLASASLFPVGSLVELNDHRIAKVVHSNDDELKKPVISILTDTKKKVLKRDKIYQENLKNNTALQIIKALHSNYLEGIKIMDGF